MFLFCFVYSLAFRLRPFRPLLPSFGGRAAAGAVAKSAFFSVAFEGFCPCLEVASFADELIAPVDEAFAGLGITCVA
jgi:hypothetical protein